MSRIARLFGFMLFAAAAGSSADEPKAGLFRNRIGPLFERRCLSCHNDEERKGGLSLQTRKSAFAGGESGPAIVQGDIGASYLLDLVTAANGRAEMPKDGAALSAEEVELLREWVAGGAVWPEGVTLEAGRVADADWWSLKPVVRPAVPEVAKADRGRVRTPVDAFVLAKLREAGLGPSPEADRRTLIRRLSFDLLGLPPTPEEVEAFVGDPDPLAYENLVERYLADPRYGERWARHWLDVAHYGDSHGYDKDKPRPNAWPYRDYVIRSFNEDKPYGRFVREQIAGDVLYPDDADGVVATGFLAAGPWDFISHVEVPESKLDGQVARSLDRDDFVRTTMETFTSTTVGCARCHNHMFDPVTQEDYYSIQAVFAAIDRADRAYDMEPSVRERREVLLAERGRVEAERTAAEAEHRRLIEAELGAFREAIAELVRERPPRAEFGYHSGIEAKADVEKWVQVDLGQKVQIAVVELAPCYDEFAGIGAGFGFPVRFRVEASDDPQFLDAVAVIADRAATDGRNPGVVPQRFAAAAVVGRYVRVTATKLAPRQNDFIFALAELRVLGADGENLAEGRGVDALDSIDAPPRWRKENLTDGVWFGSDAPEAYRARVAAAHAGREEAEARVAASDAARRVAAVGERLAVLDRELAALPAPRVVYAAATAFPAQGNFKPTGGTPREIRLLRRGDVKSPDKIVEPTALTAVPSLPGRFELPSGHTEGARRAALAEWVAHRDNPLTWRSVVNRVWLYHFGRGIVDTPNDFGRMGAEPSHPELLDWLAAEVRGNREQGTGNGGEDGGSLKRLQRLIVLSATYRQGSEMEDGSWELGRGDPREVDSENKFLWRMNRRRLEAEEVRDSVLAVAGRLVPGMYGPAFQDFVVEKPEHSPHYVYAKHDPNDPASHRRSVYRFIARSQPQPLLTTLDCADASMSVDKRNETVTPLQALALLNNPFMVAMSERFAERVSEEAGDVRGRVAAAVRLAFGREAEKEELDRLAAYAERNGLANACRLILNLNEFVYVD